MNFSDRYKILIECIQISNPRIVIHKLMDNNLDTEKSDALSYAIKIFCLSYSFFFTFFSFNFLKLNGEPVYYWINDTGYGRGHHNLTLNTECGNLKKYKSSSFLYADTTSKLRGS